MCSVTFFDLIKHVCVSESELKQKCTREHLDIITKEIGNWLDYVYPLGLSDQETNAIRTDSMLSYSAKSRRMLEVWHNKNGFEATYGQLANTFLQGGNANIAETVCRLVKSPPVPPAPPAQLTKLTPPTFVSRNGTLASDASLPTQETTNILDEETRENLEGRLLHEAQQMETFFCKFVSKLRKSLETRNVNPSVIGNHLSMIKATTKQLQDDHSVPNLFHLIRQELVNVGEIGKLFQLITPYVSFFNYDIIESILEEYGDSEDKEKFKVYLEKFEVFCKRRATEVPSVLDGEDSTTTHLRVKVEDDFQHMYTVKAVRSFRAKLCTILGVTEPCLRLVSIENGCILLTFILPTFILPHVFPLADGQEKALVVEGVSGYTVGNWPTKKLIPPVRQDITSNTSVGTAESPSQDNPKINLSNATALCQSENILSEQDNPKLPVRKQQTRLIARSPMSTPETPARRSCKTPPPFSYVHSPGIHTGYRLSPSKETSSPGRSSTSPTWSNAFMAGRNSISPTPGNTDRGRSPPPPIRPQAIQRRSLSMPFLLVSKNSSSVPLGTTSISPEKPIFGPGATFSAVPKRPSKLFTSKPLQPVKHETSSHNQQLTALLGIYKHLKCVLGLFYMPGSNRVTGEIEKVMKKALYGSQSVVKVFKMTSDGSFWLTNAVKTGVTNYVFLGYPPVETSDRSARMSRFFNPRENHGRRVVEIIFVTNVQATPSPTSQRVQEAGPRQKQLQQFLHLDGSLKTTYLVDCILAHFAAPSPIPADSHNVFWSAYPKLLNVKNQQRSLGLTLVTRDMSQTSAFPKITLIKKFRKGCLSELPSLVGRYTHIQSINGHFLDGLSIEEVTPIFKSECKKDCVQLMVRYIHSKQTADHTSSPCSTEHRQDDLPITVSILANNYKTASQLFACLTKTQVKSSASSLSSSHTPSLSASSVDLDSVDQVFNEEGGYTPQDRQDTVFEYSQKSHEVGPCIESAKYIVQANISVEQYEFLPSESSPTLSSTSQLKPQPTAYRQFQIADKRFILQMFQKDFDRRLVHLFLRSSGLFLVTAWLEELADDPLIQYENLSYWLRLILTRLSSFGEKRVMIVGLFDSREHDSLNKIQEYVRYLNNALRESELTKHLFDWNRERRLPTEKRQHRLVHMFDISQSVESSRHLLARINECMDLFIMKTSYYDKSFFTSVFKAFSGLNIALKELSTLSGVLASPTDLQTICHQKPAYALETLAAYSTALVNVSKGDALLKPAFLVDILLMFEVFQDPVIYDVFAISAIHLKNLPIVSAPLMLHIMERVCTDQDMPQLNDDSKLTILDWAESLGLMFRIGEGTKREVYYFVPLLATSLLGDKAKFSWDPKTEKAYKSETIVLYAYLRFPATYQFFYRLLAVLLKDGFHESKNTHNFRINYGCNEAILPVCCADPPRVLGVMAIYHPLQNVIEFRTRQSEQRVPIGRSLLQAVQSKLKSAFQTSCYVHNYTFDDAFSFHIPSPVYDSKLLSSELWKLWELELKQGSGEADNHSAEPVNLLLKTKELTSAQLQEWGEVSHSGKKDIPAEMFLKWAKRLSSSEDHWAQVGAKLNLLSTDDIHFLRVNPGPAGNGDKVLRRWYESLLSYKDLVSVLSSPDVRLTALANEIESYFTESDM